jgi:hypothetical protein
MDRPKNLCGIGTGVIEMNGEISTSSLSSNSIPSDHHLAKLSDAVSVIVTANVQLVEPHHTLRIVARVVLQAERGKLVVVPSRSIRSALREAAASSEPMLSSFL